MSNSVLEIRRLSTQERRQFERKYGVTIIKMPKAGKPSAK